MGACVRVRSTQSNKGTGFGGLGSSMDFRSVVRGSLNASVLMRCLYEFWDDFKTA